MPQATHEPHPRLSRLAGKQVQTRARARAGATRSRYPLKLIYLYLNFPLFAVRCPLLNMIPEGVEHKYDAHPLFFAITNNSRDKNDTLAS